MKLFTLADRYDQHTGKKEQSFIESGSYICDYCGTVIDDVDFEEYSHHSYRIEEYEWLEPYFDGDSLIFNGKPINLHELMNKHPEFTYCLYTYNNCERNLIAEASRNIDCNTVAYIMYSKRWQVVQNLLESGDYTMENLQLVY